MTIPYVRSSRQDGAYIDLVSYLMENRVLFVGPELTTEMAVALCMQILFLSQEEAPISLYINCYGGSVPAGLAVMDVINAVDRKAPVHTYCIGECVGVMLTILAAGRKGKRRAFPSARFSLFQEWYGVESLWGARSQDHDERHRLMDVVQQALRARTGLDALEPNEFRNHLTTLSFFDAAKAKDYGIIDEISGADLPAGLAAKAR